ncbi:hypothetical protein Hanom_Chr08g00724121 [Helianthus anomalus]
MSTSEKLETFAEEMSSSLPPLNWLEETFIDLVKGFKFTDSWGAIYPPEGQTVAQAPAGYIIVLGLFRRRKLPISDHKIFA